MHRVVVARAALLFVITLGSTAKVQPQAPSYTPFGTGCVGSVGGQAAWDTLLPSGPESVALGDLNGDGSPDPAVVNRDKHSISLLLNQR